MAYTHSIVIHQQDMSNTWYTYSAKLYTNKTCEIHGIHTQQSYTPTGPINYMVYVHSKVIQPTGPA